MDLLYHDLSQWVTFAVIAFLNALFTGLMLVAVIAFTVRFLKVRGVTFKYETENREQDRGE